ncbi:HAMP domain-containing sensor histidine kinase [Neptuniibacter sp.]|uniref:sensor histidine kinase n=1 Tax=Neptuniibacter sp. TaxID=1962643 RepID=UPI00260DBD6D|nr:HAMP domain-containing sensor histidine kinase [Neptuniibacter sp.]MCP4598802.1 HAMP domain-containing histidine kinase [Neptuniibacter sp.]
MFKKLQKPRSMRRELSLYILTLSLAIGFAFMYALNSYFERGLDLAAESTMLIEARSFAKEYRKNSDTPLPSGYITKFYLDNLDNAPELYRKLLNTGSMKMGEFSHEEWSPHGFDEWKDSRYLIAYKHQLHDGRSLFLITDYEANLMTKEEQTRFDSTFTRVFYFVGGFLFLMLTVVWFYNRRISHHTQHLALWAEQISMDNVNQPLPDFRYAELNKIAEQLKGSYERNAKFIEREHQFLRHSSHELRTPIAVIRGNLELLHRVGYPASMQRPIERIERSSHSMQQLTETLLWISRESEKAPHINQVNLRETTEELIEELDYLLQDKEVEVVTQYSTDLSALSLAETPFKIVLSNLIRNAFQYTYSGLVTIKISNEKIEIENRNTEAEELESGDSFGLGLMLVTKICERLNWDLAIQQNELGAHAVLILKKSQH